MRQQLLQTTEVVKVNRGEKRQRESKRLTDIKLSTFVCVCLCSGMGDEDSMHRQLKLSYINKSARRCLVQTEKQTDKSTSGGGKVKLVKLNK